MPGLEVDGCPIRRCFDREAEALSDQATERIARPIFTMCEDDTRFRRRDRAEPVEQILLTGVAAQPAEHVRLCPHGHPLSGDSHLTSAVGECAADRTAGLVADHE